MIEDFKKRLIVEVRELNARVNKLDDFISGNPKFKELDDFNREVLEKQLKYMTGYLECLNARVNTIVSSEEVDEFDAMQGKNLSFGEALVAIKEFKVLRREGWNGKGLVVFRQVPAYITGDIVPNMQSLPDSAKTIIMATQAKVDYTSQMLIFNTNNGRADSWVPSISDALAEDWEIVDPDSFTKK